MSNPETLLSEEKRAAVISKLRDANHAVCHDKCII